MSHFAGLVVLTPNYLNSHYGSEEALEDALEKYDENKSVPEHSIGLVSNYDKCFFLRHSNEDIVDEKFEYKIYRRLYRRGKVLPFNKQNEWGCRDRYINYIANQDKEYYVRCFLIEYPELFENFEKEYKEKGDKWNGGRWRINPENGKWEEYSTYNPNSVYDYYSTNCRFAKTLNGEKVSNGYLDELDLSQFTPQNIPYCLFVDDVHYSQGKMGWWGMSDDDMTDEEWRDKFIETIKDLPSDSEFYVLDLHI